MKSLRSEEPLSTTSKNKGFVFDIGNQSTTRVHKSILALEIIKNSISIELIKHRRVR